MIRDKLKGLTPNEDYGHPNYFHWSVGDDVPTSWDPIKLKRIGKKTIRQNFIHGIISKVVYKRLIHANKIKFIGT